MRRTVAGSAAALLLAASLSACGGGDGPGGDQPTPTRSPTLELPTPTRSASAPEPTSADPEHASRADQRTLGRHERARADQRRTLGRDRPSRSRPGRRPGNPSPTASRRTSPTRRRPSLRRSRPRRRPTTTRQPTRRPTTTPSWLWWLLAALVLGAVVAIPLLRALPAPGRLASAALRGRGRARLARARAAARSCAASAPVEQVAGGWAVALPRVTAAEDAADGARVQRLRRRAAGIGRGHCGTPRAWPASGWSSSSRPDRTTPGPSTWTRSWPTSRRHSGRRRAAPA